MSDANAPKKSVLTDAMERVQAKLNAETANEQEPTTEKKFFSKKNLVRVGAAAALGGIAAVLIVKHATKLGENENSEEATPED